MMTEEDRQRGLELQGYINSVRDMTLKEIAIKHLKKYHLPKFLAMSFVEFSYPLLVTKDCEIEKRDKQLTKAKDHIKRLLSCLQQDTNDPQTNYYVVKYTNEAEQFLEEVE